MDKQESVQFLLGAVGMLRAQYQMWSTEMGFDFIQSGLELPPLRVQRGQLSGWGSCWVAGWW